MECLEHNSNVVVTLSQCSGIVLAVLSCPCWSCGICVSLFTRWSNFKKAEIDLDSLWIKCCSRMAIVCTNIMIFLEDWQLPWWQQKTRTNLDQHCECMLTEVMCSCMGTAREVVWVVVNVLIGVLFAFSNNELYQFVIKVVQHFNFHPWKISKSLSLNVCNFYIF